MCIRDRYLDRWEDIGLNIQLTTQKGQAYRLFQLQQLVSMTLQ